MENARNEGQARRTDRRWLRKRGENRMQSGRNPDTGSPLLLLAGWLDGWMEWNIEKMTLPWHSTVNINFQTKRSVYFPLGNHEFENGKRLHESVKPNSSAVVHADRISSSSYFVTTSRQCWSRRDLFLRHRHKFSSPALDIGLFRFSSEVVREVDESCRSA
jgi:hypothetical protein